MRAGAGGVTGSTGPYGPHTHRACGLGMDTPSGVRTWELSPYIRLCGIFHGFCVRTDVRCPPPRPHQTTSRFLGQEPTLSSLPLSWWGASAHRGPGQGSAFFGCPSLTCLDSVGSSTPRTLERLAVCCWAWEPPGLLDPCDENSDFSPSTAFSYNLQPYSLC